MVIIFQSIIFFTSSKLTTMLTDGNNIQNPEISEIVARVYIQKIFIYFYNNIFIRPTRINKITGENVFEGVRIFGF